MNLTLFQVGSDKFDGRMGAPENGTIRVSSHDRHSTIEPGVVGVKKSSKIESRPFASPTSRIEDFRQSLNV